MIITIKDIAKIAGVSHSTVSRCLNNKKGVSDETCGRIKKIAEDLGFEFNANARSLSTAKTGTIGIIYDEDHYESSLHPYTMSFQKYIRRSLEREDLDTIITFSKNQFTGYDNVERLINKRKVDGVIIISSDISHSTLDFLKKRNVPFVFSHQTPDKSFGDVDCVYCDHLRGGYTAGAHLAAAGCRSLLCITRTDTRAEFSLRTEGFLSAAADMGIPQSSVDVFPGGVTFKSGYDFVRKNLSKITKYNGIFVHTDLLALGVLKALRENGTSVPEDIAVVGYDGIEICNFVNPTLTSVEQPGETISILTCERLIELISGVKKIKSRRIIIPPNLVERESSKFRIK